MLIQDINTASKIVGEMENFKRMGVDLIWANLKRGRGKGEGKGDLLF